MAAPRLSLSDWAEPRLPQLADDAYRAILKRIPLFREDLPVPHADLRRSIEHNLGFILTAIVRPPRTVDVTAPQETGRRRARQGVPLPEVLRAYRISFSTLWDELLEAARSGRRSITTDSLLTATVRIWEATDEHAVALTEAYRATSAELLVAEQHRRSALVEALLTGHPGPEGGPWEAAALLNLTPDADLVVVAAETRGLADDSLPGVERRLGDLGIVSGWRLTPSLHLGIVSLHPDEHETLLRLLREKATARTGISPAYRSFSDTPRALQLARAALSLVPAGRAEVHVFDPSPLAALLARERGEGQRLAREVLGAVLELATSDRAILIGTLVAYLDHGGSAERASRAIGCHANTVRYRLRRLQTLTGRSLSDPHGTAELMGAALALRLTSSAAPIPGWQDSPGARRLDSDALLAASQKGARKATP